MARVNAITTNFTAGELSPRMYGRVDFDKYRNGVKTLENMTVFPQGGIGRRAGSKHVALTKHQDKKARLIPFEFSDIQAYILEVGDLYIRFFADEGQVVDGGLPVEVPTLYLESELFDLHSAQSADVMYITDVNHPTQSLSRVSATEFTITDTEFNDGPYLPEEDDPQPGEASQLTITGDLTGIITVTANDQLFDPLDTTGPGGTGLVDRHLRIYDGTDWHFTTITGYTSGTVVTAVIQNGTTIAGITPHLTTRWRLGSFSSLTGFPRTVTFFQNRLCLAASAGQPQTIWMSATDDYPNFSPGALDADAVTVTLASNKVNIIKWISPIRKALFASTVSSEWEIGSSAGPVTPSNVTAFQRTFEGSAAIQPVQAKNIICFVQHDERRLHSINFDFASDNFISPDLTLLAEHVVPTGIVQLDYQAGPDPIIWTVEAGGELLGATFLEEHDIVAWHRHILGGSFGSGNALVESASVIHYEDGDAHEYQVWLESKRTVNGATVRYVEFLDQDVRSDSTLIYSGAATDSVSGLGHLEGETVTARVKKDPDHDWSALATEVVVAGSITLDDMYTDIQVGLPYNQKITFLPTEFGAQAGAALTQRRRVHEISLLIRDSVGGTINGDPIVLRNSANLMDQGLPPETGVYTYTPDTTWGPDQGITIEGDQPLEFYLTAAVFGMNVSDG